MNKIRLYLRIWNHQCRMFSIILRTWVKSRGSNFKSKNLNQPRVNHLMADQRLSRTKASHQTSPVQATERWILQDRNPLILALSTTTRSSRSYASPKMGSCPSTMTPLTISTSYRHLKSKRRSTIACSMKLALNTSSAFMVVLTSAGWALRCQKRQVKISKMWMIREGRRRTIKLKQIRRLHEGTS